MADNKLNFLEAQKPILTVLKLFGCFPYRLHSKTLTVENNKIIFAYSIFVNFSIEVFFILYHFTMLKEVSNYLEDNNEATTVATALEGYLVAFCFAIVSLSLFFRKKLQMKIIILIIELEKEVGDIRSYQLDYNEQLRRSSVRFVVSQIILTVIALSHYVAVTYLESVAYFLFEMFVYFTYVSIVLFITCFMENLVKTIGNLFDALNSSLKLYVTTCPFHFYNREMKKVFALHNRLIQSIELFNAAFGSIAAGIFYFIFATVVFEVYFVSAEIFDSANSLDFQKALKLLGNMFSVMPMLIIFSKFGFTCESVQEKVSGRDKCFIDIS